ncbi:MAG: metal-dependent transcriptional regulator, partial [Candidatus Latescibacteria bacterium]|nr:metal-dependent transcriptional regulator [Candidatus Latescibacterota bacterium]
IGVPPSAAASQACDVEHFLRPDVIEHICTFLGHPRNCPHGRPIPLGLCCTSSDHSVEPLVQQLSSVNPGATVRIIFIRPQTHARLDRLAAMGVVPGTTIHLHQKKPAFVILFGETELAIEARVADDIYVRRTYGDT